MARIEIHTCDWTKKRLGKNEQTHTLVVGSNEYEISDEALAEIKARLEGDEVPERVAEAPVRAPQPIRVAPPVVAVSDDAEPNGAALDDQEEAPETTRVHPNVPPLTVPTSTKERLPMPTPAQAETVIAESVRFQEGTLRALTHGKARKAAEQVLSTKWEERFEDNQPQRQLPDRARRGE